MATNFQELIKLLQLQEIRFMDSHESVLQVINNINDNTKVLIKTEQAFRQKDPIINDNIIVFCPKYVFTFFIEDKLFFKCEYIISISFKTDDSKKVQALLEDKETKNIFLTQQLNKTLWSILRGTIMDAFNRHSLRPVVLPWVL